MARKEHQKRQPSKHGQVNQAKISIYFATGVLGPVQGRGESNQSRSWSPTSKCVLVDFAVDHKSRSMGHHGRGTSAEVPGGT